MIFYILKWSIIYSILIIIIHDLFIYFQNNLTITKTKDYYNYPIQELNNINKILSNNTTNTINTTNSNTINTTNSNITNTTNSNITNTTNSNIKMDNLIDKFNITDFNNKFDNKDNYNIKNELSDFLTKLK